MASKESASNKMLSMKLLVNSKTQRVLYAEAGKDVVDFLFSLLTLPVGTVVKLLSSDTMVGSVGNLYGSVEKLDDTYVSHEDARKALLTPAGACGSNKLLQLPEQQMESSVLYRCNYSGSSSCRNYVTKVSGLGCPNCNTIMATQLQPLVESNGGSVGRTVPRSAGAGFVQGIVTYTVMDDLKVSPMSSISGITLLNTFGVTDIGSLKEKTVQLGYTEGLEILKASLQSKTVLTDVFLGKKMLATYYPPTWAGPWAVRIWAWAARKKLKPAATNTRQGGYEEGGLERNGFGLLCLCLLLPLLLFVFLFSL